VRDGPSDPQRGALQTRVNELSSAHAPFWLGPLRQLEHARSFDRGLLQLHVEARPLLTLGGSGLADTETYAWLDGLRIRSGVTAALGRLVGSGFLRGLKSLGLRRCALRSTAVKSLFKAADLASLRVLDLGENTIGEEGVRALVRSPYLHRLQRLNLGENSLGFDALGELGKADFLPSLTALELNGNWMGTETAVALVSGACYRSFFQAGRLLATLPATSAGYHPINGREGRLPGSGFVPRGPERRVGLPSR
jgi:Leucine Rich Repeat (LRR) protein